MINKDFQEYPEHRTNFYILLQQVVTYCFSSLLNIVPAQFKLILDSIIWAFKHTMRNVADTGLRILFNLLENMSKEDVVYSNMFYQTYYTDIMQHMFSVVTDTSHTAGLTMQANILAYMFFIVESGKITVPLNPTVQTAKGQNNVQYVQDFVSDLLKGAFSHLSEAQIKITVQGFFNLDQDVVAFKEHLRDFLVQIRVSDESALVFLLYDLQFLPSNLQEFSGQDDSDLFLDERESELKKKEDDKRRVQLSVPGIINPHDLPEVMDDDN